MQSIENSEQFRKTAQELLQRLNDRINDLSNSGYKGDQQVNQDTNKEIEQLRTQHQNVKEALHRYGNEGESNWQKIKGEAQYALEEVENHWKTNNNISQGTQNQAFKQGDQWRVSTGQSDRGAHWNTTGLGDRAGMEDPQTGLDNSTQYTSFGNTRREEEEQEQERGRTRQSESDERTGQHGNQGNPTQEQNNEGRTRRQGNPDDWKTHQEGSSNQTSYEQMQASNRERQQDKDDSGLSKTNRGGDATQDDPGGSADKGDRQSNYISPDTKESREEAAERRPMDSRSM